MLFLIWFAMMVLHTFAAVVAWLFALVAQFGFDFVGSVVFVR